MPKQRFLSLSQSYLYDAITWKKSNIFGPSDVVRADKVTSGSMSPVLKKNISIGRSLNRLRTFETNQNGMQKYEMVWTHVWITLCFKFQHWKKDTFQDGEWAIFPWSSQSKSCSQSKLKLIGLRHVFREFPQCVVCEGLKESSMMMKVRRGRIPQLVFGQQDYPQP